MKGKRPRKLKKTMSPMGIFSIALGSIIGWGCFVLPGDRFLPIAGPLGTAIAMGIGAIMMIIIAANYGYMVKKFPVAGGEFAYAFQGFNRHHAFICAWFLGISYISIVPLNATALGLVGRYLFPGVLQKGLLYSIAGWEVYLGEIIIASTAIIVFGIMAIKGTKIVDKLQTIITLFLIGSILVIGSIVLSSPEVSFNNLYPLFSPNTIPIVGILSIVATAPFLFVGFDCIPQAAEEFNFSPKKTFWLMTIAIIFGALIYITMTIITAIVIPWYEMLQSNPFWATGFVVENLMGIAGLILLGIALLAAIFSGMTGFFMSASRLLLSLTRANILPKWFGKIHRKYHTPHNSIIFVMVLSLIAPWFGRKVLTWVVDMAAIGAAFGYLYTSMSTYRVMKRRNEKSILYCINSIIGTILSLIFILLLLVPGAPGHLTTPSLVALVVWCILGIMFYFITGKEYRTMKRGELQRLILNKK